jgi:hypothetical protein
MEDGGGEGGRKRCSGREGSPSHLTRLSGWIPAAEIEELVARISYEASLLPRALVRACVLGRMSERVGGCAVGCVFGSMDGSDCLSRLLIELR